MRRCLRYTRSTVTRYIIWSFQRIHMIKFSDLKSMTKEDSLPPITFKFIHFISLSIRHLWIQTGKKTSENQEHTWIVLFPRECQLRQNASPLQAPASHSAPQLLTQPKLVQDLPHSDITGLKYDGMNRATPPYTPVQPGVQNSVLQEFRLILNTVLEA